MQILDIFPTPIGQFKLDFRPREIIDIIERVEPIWHPNLKRTSYGTMQNCLDLEALQPLTAQCLRAVDEYRQLLRLQEQRIIGSWYTKTLAGEQLTAHRHPGCMISGVFYLKCPEGSADLEFIDPNNSLRMHEQPTKFLKWPIPAEVGKLILFPSWLEHDTQPNSAMMQGERISIAFNCS